MRVVWTPSLSILDISLYDTLFLSAKHAYLRDFRSPLSKGVQLGQVAIYCRVSTDDQCCKRQERDLRAFARRAGPAPQRLSPVTEALSPYRRGGRHTCS